MFKHKALCVLNCRSYCLTAKKKKKKGLLSSADLHIHFQTRYSWQKSFRGKFFRDDFFQPKENCIAYKILKRLAYEGRTIFDNSFAVKREQIIAVT